LKTHESSPDEFLSANEAMSASASFSEQKERKKSHDDADSPRDKFVCDTNKIEEETSEGEDNGSESAQTMDIENSQTNGANNFPSLSSEEGGYLMGTPPTMSLDSEIQPCAVDIDLQQSGPSSLTNMSWPQQPDQHEHGSQVCLLLYLIRLQVYYRV